MNTAPGGTRMHAAVLEGPGRIRVNEVARPEPGPGQVRVRLEGCGVCASNLMPWSGPEWMNFPTEPGAMGHEGWGVIDAVGPASTACPWATAWPPSPTRAMRNTTWPRRTRWCACPSRWPAGPSRASRWAAP
jgi:threonine dehydrogenase-like Zn-dependent dehydrogenase